MSLVSLFADMTYEGGRSVTGPFFAFLGASGAVVGFVAGFGELLGFGLRYFSGIAADRTGKYWGTALLGYTINVLSVPALALARSWPGAAALVVGERIGRGVRKPASNALISYAGSELGHGWVFGFREAMDQTGATIGPILVAFILYFHGGFERAFGALFVPALLAIIVLIVAWRQFPVPRHLETKPIAVGGNQQRSFWLYAIGGACLGAGFADFALISFHFSKMGVFKLGLIPILYAAAMLVGAIGSPLLGKAYDRYGNAVLVGAFGLTAIFAPLAFLGTSWAAFAGVLLWGLGMAAQDTLFPAVIVQLAAADRRATALGTFDAIYGVAWFLGSSVMGLLYDRSFTALVIFSLVLQAAGLPLLVVAGRRLRSA
ncbi:MAG TPA: MFS transporter [Candidatus Rubrimentiphilum sp.]|nr:MFS transporter [Candidatus Rubrimentiphilum sp.]